jgi:hypothetical protein
LSWYWFGIILCGFSRKVRKAFPISSNPSPGTNAVWVANDAVVTGFVGFGGVVGNDLSVVQFFPRSENQSTLVVCLAVGVRSLVAGMATCYVGFVLVSGGIFSLFYVSESLPPLGTGTG